MKRRYQALLLTLGMTTALIIIPRLIRKLSNNLIPAGWKKTMLYITNIENYEGSYAYMLTYNYQEGDEQKTMEQYILDDRKPQAAQCIAAIYNQEEPILFELLQLIQYE